MKAAKTVLIVEPPDEGVASKYLLAVTRPGNITAGPSLIFIAADALRRCPDDEHSMEALRASEIVARFPATLPYLLIERGATRFVSQVQIAKYEKSVGDRIRKLYGGELVQLGDATALLLREAGSGHKHGQKEAEVEEILAYFQVITYRGFYQ